LILNRWEWQGSAWRLGGPKMGPEGGIQAIFPAFQPSAKINDLAGIVRTFEGGISHLRAVEIPSSAPDSDR
jgi:hypothetical protein